MHLIIMKIGLTGGARVLQQVSSASQHVCWLNLYISCVCVCRSVCISVTLSVQGSPQRLAMHISLSILPTLIRHFVSYWVIFEDISTCFYSSFILSTETEYSKEESDIISWDEPQLISCLGLFITMLNMNLRHHKRETRMSVPNFLVSLLKNKNVNVMMAKRKRWSQNQQKSSFGGPANVVGIRVVEKTEREKKKSCAPITLFKLLWSSIISEIDCCTWHVFKNRDRSFPP